MPKSLSKLNSSSDTALNKKFRSPTRGGDRAVSGAMWGSVCAVIVTYGERTAFCSRAVESAIESGVDRVVVVANGLSSMAFDDLTKHLSAHTAVELLILEVNAGSAGGYAAGIRRAKAHDPRWIWLLDDDNWCEPGALMELLSAASSFDSRVGGLQCGRPSDRFLSDVAAGRRRHPPVGAFLNFDLVHRLRRSRPTKPAVRLPYAPYGGLLLRSEVVDMVGLPDSSLILYEDDTEYTSRMVKAGWILRMVPSVTVKDAIPKWTVGKRNITRLYSSEHPIRVYYSVRNRLLFERSQLTSTVARLRFALNGVCFITARFLFEGFEIRPQAMLAFLRGLWDGLNDVRGVSPHYNSVSGIPLAPLELHSAYVRTFQAGGSSDSRPPQEKPSGT